MPCVATVSLAFNCYLGNFYYLPLSYISLLARGFRLQVDKATPWRPSKGLKIDRRLSSSTQTPKSTYFILYKHSSY
jgi:hypothetical protein